MLVTSGIRKCNYFSIEIEQNYTLSLSRLLESDRV